MATATKSEAAVKLSARQMKTISRALADPRRFEILQKIAGQRCQACSDLRECFPITAATMSHHLKELQNAGLIETTRRGKFVDMTFCRDIWDAYLAELNKM
jgi:ArsR family transcriptional regulator, arsenate/arsenite/antimonite-responsive transcriptional repressor